MPLRTSALLVELGRTERELGTHLGNDGHRPAAASRHAEGPDLRGQAVKLLGNGLDDTLRGFGPHGLHRFDDSSRPLLVHGTSVMKRWSFSVSA